jgi:ATP-binding cassette subfamily G (WHITE) protein 1
LGPSGSGKSTLLNALSGFQRQNISGSIKMNGLDIDKFRSHIAYILQDNHLQPLLTVSESMNFAVKFKTGNSLNAFKKWKKISDILETFGLAEKDNKKDFQ